VPKDLADYEYRYIESSLDGSVENPLLMMTGFALRPEEQHPIVTMNQDGDVWTIVMDKTGSRIVLKVSDQGVVPEFEVVRNDFR
ncbi:MAG: hypothetical protein ACJ07L_11425, partial [Opitutales bacterium]